MGLFTVRHLALDHRPHTKVGAGEVGPAGMAQEDLEAVGDSIGEKTRRSQDP